MLTAARYIRAETAVEHRQTERVAVATGFLDAPDAYLRYLRALHGFYYGIEASFDALPELARALPDLAERKKVHWLAADLAALGTFPSPSIRAFDHADLASALGALYVIEGATLGGRWILAHLDPSIPPEARTFFRGYGVETAGRFKTMCRALDAHDGARVRMAAAARETFGAMRRWIQTCGVPP